MDIYWLLSRLFNIHACMLFMLTQKCERDKDNMKGREIKRERVKANKE